MDNPRKLALASLVKADALSSYSNIEVNSSISRANLRKNDISLYTALYVGVTERLITLDYIISQYSDIPLAKLDIETRNTLRLGFYQLVFMDKIPDYSAVSETVNLSPKKSKGYVNAVLRSFIRNEKKIEYPDDEWEAFSIKNAIPVSILNILKDSYGKENAEKIALSSSHRGGISLRINTIKIDEKEFEHMLKFRHIDYEKASICDGVYIVFAPFSEVADIVEIGFAFVQDASSRTAVSILSPQKNETILDACACPGGKSFSSAIDMQNMGEIISCDLHSNKMSLVSEGAKRLGITILKTRVQNATQYVEEWEKRFDRVLCDAPCSGLGVISKKPDIKYKDVSAFENLPTVQGKILKNCANYVKVGGVLVYSTCTLNLQENENVVNNFLKENPNFAPCDFSVGDIKSENGMYTFFTYKTNTDGFFVAKMTRLK